MKTLEQTIAKMERGAAQSLRKHLAAVGINGWEDITRSTLYDLKDHLGETVAGWRWGWASTASAWPSPTRTPTCTAIPA